MEILVPKLEDLCKVGGKAFEMDKNGNLVVYGSCGCGGPNGCGSSACNCS